MTSHYVKHIIAGIDLITGILGFAILFVVVFLFNFIVEIFMIFFKDE